MAAEVPDLSLLCFQSVLLPEVSGRLELSLNDHGAGERRVRRLEERELLSDSENFCSSF